MSNEIKGQSFSIVMSKKEYDKLTYIQEYLGLKKKTDTYRYMLRYVYRKCELKEIDTL